MTKTPPTQPAPDSRLSFAPRQTKLSAHNWHSWSTPPSGSAVVDRESRSGSAVADRESRSGSAVVELPRAESLSAAQSIVRSLCDVGICTFFGLPGGPVIPIFDAILTEPRARLIEPRHETCGAFAAMGYYRATGRVPVVVVTAGPGATNAVTGITAAALERVPLIVLCGDVPAAACGRRMVQDSSDDGIGIERMLQKVTRASVRIHLPQSAATQVRAAVEAACDPRDLGPVLCVIPIDRAGSRGAPPILCGAPPTQRRSAAAPPPPALLKEVLSRLRGAERPLLLLGSGARGSADAALALAEALALPFVTTPMAKGLLPEEHPLSLRTCGMGASTWARRYMNGDGLSAGPDVTLVLGSDLDDVAVCATPPICPGGALIHVDHDAAVFARNVPTALAVLHDVGAFTAALRDAAGQQAPSPAAAASLRAAKTGSPFDVADHAGDRGAPIAPHRAVAELQAAAGPGATFVSDIGEHMLFALHYLTIGAARGAAYDSDARFVIHLGLGSMGSGIGSAIGLSLGQAERAERPALAPPARVVCICGDGGMQMVGMELLVAIKLRLPIIYAVFNDARYNMVYHGYRLTFGREAAFDTPVIDFARWAEALGARGHRIERPGEITAALLARLTEGGLPAVLDIRHDAEVRAKSGGRVEAVRDMLR